MAIGEHKNKSPYHGVFVAGIFMIAVPVLLFFLIKGAIALWKPGTNSEVAVATAKTIGLGAGFLFHLSLVIAGVMSESFGAVVKRIANFFENLKFSFKLAWTCYVEEVKETGLAFWIFLAIMIVNFCFFWSGAHYFLMEFFG